MGFQEREVWVAMNDGVRLDASVCTPEGAAPEGGWPAVLMAHGHGDAGSKASMLPRGRRYAERGFLSVCYSVRGQGESEGLVFHMGARELFDLQDVVRWVLRELPAHPKGLAVCGGSQGGWHAYMAAAHCPEVATVVAENMAVDCADFAVHNGCLTKWFFTRTMRRRILTAGLQEMAREWAIRGEWFRIRAWVDATSPIHFVDRIRCPVLIIHGWHDVGMPANRVVEMFDRLRVPKRLYLGGGGHEGVDDPEAQTLRTRMIDRWLDHWLKGEPNGIVDEAPVLYARRPEWAHVAADAMPPSGVATRTLYLRAGGKLSEEAPAGPDTHANVTNRPLDPDYGLPQALHDDMAGVPKALAREVVPFDGEPLGEAVEIVGTPRFRFHLMPNRAAFQVNAELFDVAPDGTVALVTRDQWGTRSAEPGRHVEAAFDARTIAYVVAAGHRLRLAVSNYDTMYAFPYFEPFVARLYHDFRRASAVDVPVRPVTG